VGVPVYGTEPAHGMGRHRRSRGDLLTAPIFGKAGARVRAGRAASSVRTARGFVDAYKGFVKKRRNNHSEGSFFPTDQLSGPASATYIQSPGDGPLSRQQDNNDINRDMHPFPVLQVVHHLRTEYLKRWFRTDLSDGG